MVCYKTKLSRLHAEKGEYQYRTMSIQQLHRVMSQALGVLGIYRPRSCVYQIPDTGAEGH